MEALSKTLTHGDFDSVFKEVEQPETVADGSTYFQGRSVQGC